MAHDVFISFASQDGRVASMLVSALEQVHVRCWISSRDIASGADYASAIDAAVEACEALIVVLSEHALRSDYVRNEVKASVDHKKRRLAFRIDDAPIDRGFEFLLGTVQYHPAQPRLGAIEAHVAAFVPVVQRFLRGEMQRFSIPPGAPRRAFVLRLVLALALGSLVLAAGAFVWQALAAQPDPARPAAAVDHTKALPSGFKALLIGVGDYAASTGWRSLPAASDVAAIDTALREARYETWTLTTASRRRVDRGLILQSVERFLQDTSIFDTALVYIAAHGATKPWPMLLPSDCARANAAACGVSLSDLKELIRKGTARRKLLVLDSCFADASLDGKDVPCDLSIADDAFATLTSRRGDERSNLDKAESAFARHFAATLRDRRPLAIEGRMTLQHLTRQVADAVREHASKRMGGAQNAVLQPADADFTVIEAPGGLRHAQRVASGSQRFKIKDVADAELMRRYRRELLKSVGPGGRSTQLPFVPLTQPGVVFGEGQVRMQLGANADFSPSSEEEKERITEIWRLFGSTRGAHVTNERKLRIVGVSVGMTPAPMLSLAYGSSRYQDYVGTNLAADFVDEGNGSKYLRDVLEPGPALAPLRHARCANHLGISALITTTDHQVVFETNSEKVATFPEMLAPGVSASCDANECGPPGNIFAAIRRQAEEELGIIAEEISDVRLLGIARELRRAGKPEAYFHMFVELSFAELEARARAHAKQHAGDIPAPGAPRKAWNIGALEARHAIVASTPEGFARLPGDGRTLIELFTQPNVAPPTEGAVAYYLAWAETLPR